MTLFRNIARDKKVLDLQAWWKRVVVSQEVEMNKVAEYRAESIH